MQQTFTDNKTFNKTDLKETPLRPDFKILSKVEC